MESPPRRSTKRPKILMLADANFLAHTSRCTEIGKVLRRDYGYDVVFAGDGKFMRLPRELGFETDYVYTMQGKSTLDLAKKAGYGLFHGCMSSPQAGAMGVHFVNGDLVGDGEVVLVVRDELDVEH
ncbi:MAG: hypothetical protein ACWGSD_14200, partial [Thermodesulfobacteriota bacterium]